MGDSSPRPHATTVEGVFREAYGQAVATLVRTFGDITLDAAQVGGTGIAPGANIVTVAGFDNPATWSDEVFLVEIPVVTFRFTATDLPKGADNVMELWRGFIEEQAGGTLEDLQEKLSDQAAFAKFARQIIEDLGYVQIDTISVVNRAHHHTLWTRLSEYEPSMLDELQSVDRRIFEYWGHEASWIPLELYPAFEFRRREFRRRCPSASRRADRRWRHPPRCCEGGCGPD